MKINVGDRIFPNFIIIGAAKCGTTSLCDHLRAHPDIFVSDPKEPYFFCDLNNFDDIGKWDWYSGLFEASTNHKAIGEGTTAYSHPNVADISAQRIFGLLPDCKIIFAVRHPIRRIESDWKMRVREGWSPDSLEVALDENQSLVAHSKYWKNLGPYISRFNPQQILIVFLEDLKRDPRSELSRIYDFLDVDSSFVPLAISQISNSADSFRKDSVLSRWAKRIPIVRKLFEQLPVNTQGRIKSLFTKPYRHTPIWPNDLKNRITKELQNDAASLLRYAGKPIDFWDLGE